MKPYFSIIIPARNEEILLPKCLEAIDYAEKLLLEAREFRNFREDYRREIVVVANRCTDRTVEIAAALGCRVVQCEEKNLAAIRNTGVRASSGEILITVDADSRMSSRVLLDVWQRLSDPSIIGGGTLIIPERFSLGILTTGVLLLPIALWYRISGGLFFVRRADFEAIGGFDEGYSSVEDIAFAKSLQRHARKTGRRFVTLLRSHIVTSCRKFDRLGDWYFVKHFRESAQLLKGRDQKLADKIWYDFPR